MITTGVRKLLAQIRDVGYHYLVTPYTEPWKRKSSNLYSPSTLRLQTEQLSRSRPDRSRRRIGHVAGSNMSPDRTRTRTSRRFECTLYSKQYLRTVFLCGFIDNKSNGKLINFIDKYVFISLR